MISTAWQQAHVAALDPSRWSRRLVMAALAVAGFLVASYLASFQLGLVGSVWDPIFGRAASVRVLHSPIARSLPVPDAALGAIAYVVEVVTDLLGGSDRWRRRPWSVLLFGIVVGLLGLTALTLIAIQIFALRSFCTLCLTSAGISLVVAALAVDEVLATIHWLQTETAFGRTLGDAVVHGERSGWPDAAPTAAVRVHRLAPAADVSRARTFIAEHWKETVMAFGGDSGHGAQAAASAAGGAHGSEAGAAFGGSASTGAAANVGAANAGAANPYPPGELPNRPGGPDVDGGSEEMWRGPDRSTWAPGTGSAPARAGVAVVTGAAAGVGRATVREFAKHGYDVGLIARSRESLENAQAEVESVGRRALICAIDVADAEAVEQAAQQVEDRLGPIDVWVNDAMVSVFSPAKEMTPEEFKRVTDVNYLGYVYGTLAALKRMLPRDRGVIVHVGSALAYRSIPLQSAYCASKHAILGFHASLRTELMHDGSHVQTVMVQMPALNTPQFDWVKSRLPDKPQPVPPIYEPEVAAEAIYWASQHPRREVIVGTSTWGAINLNKVVPALLDWYLAKTGYKSQQTGQPEASNRPDNLWQPVPGDHGAHGPFDGRSAPTSPQVWATTHRPVVAGAVAAVGLLALGGLQLVTSLMRSGDADR